MRVYKIGEIVEGMEKTSKLRQIFDSRYNYDPFVFVFSYEEEPDEPEEPEEPEESNKAMNTATAPKIRPLIFLFYCLLLLFL